MHLHPGTSNESRVSCCGHLNAMAEPRAVIVSAHALHLTGTGEEKEDNQFEGGAEAWEIPQGQNG